MRYKLFILITLVLMMCAEKQTEITTSSTEALKFYNQGVKLAEKFYDVEAIEKFDQAIELDSTFVMAYYYLSRSHESLGNLAKAKEAIQTAVEFSGVTTPLEWMYVTAWEKIVDQNYTEAVEIYQNILKEYPNDRHTLFVIGKTYVLMKNYDKAIELLEKLARLEPTYASVYNQLGYAYRENGDAEKALTAFKRYAELAPNEANPHDSLGDMYRAQGEYERAIEQYKQALQAKPDFYTSHRNLGLSYLNAGDYNQAIETYQEFLKHFSERERKRDAYSDLVQVYMAKGQYNKALEYADKAIQLSETNFLKSSAIASKGLIYCFKDDYDEALRQLNAAITVFPDAIWAREGRGLVFIKQEEYGLALSEADKMKSLIDKYGLVSYKGNYNALMGRIAMAQEFYDQAIMYFKDAITFDIFDHVSNRYPLAEAYFQKRDYDKAIEICQQILKYNKNHAKTHFLLGQIYEKQYKADLAKIEYQKFLEIWKDADDNLPEIAAAKGVIQ